MRLLLRIPRCMGDAPSEDYTLQDKAAGHETPETMTGAEIGATDFAAVARAMGGHGVDVRDRETLAREAKAAFARRGFTVLACHVNADDYEGAF